MKAGGNEKHKFRWIKRCDGRIRVFLCTCFLFYQ